MTSEELSYFVEELFASPQMQSLWEIKDRGMPVFAHTIDVALLCLEAFPEWREKFPTMDLTVVIVGSLLHDLSKVAARRSKTTTHSQIMSSEPTQAVAEAIDLLEKIQLRTGILLTLGELDHIWHIIASHHGTWGKVSPWTPEAALVHQCDYLSATQHRVAPVDANDIVPLLEEGLSLKTIAAQLDVSTSVVYQRLKEACRAERVDDGRELRRRWQERGFVLTGSLGRMRQLERARHIVKRAREAPRCIVEVITEAATGRQPRNFEIG
ncbi:MAG: HD domain-containing protein [Chloroflexi bacterium]|nr:HD domain-containing protein [Chloroflexota bacterium]MCL5076244.1 HD domain-containing protein [Chloroflexota bacterium]